jgi:hypothetical protein
MVSPVKRIALAAALLAPALATGQTGTPAPGDFTVIPPGVSGPTFRIANINELVSAAQPAVAVTRPPLRLDLTDFEAEHPLVAVEGDGVRLPKEQFSLD